MTRTLDDLGWPRRTRRLSIRPARAQDAAAVFAYRRLPEVGRWLTSLPTDLGEYVGAFTKRLDSTLVVEREHRVVGDLMVTIQNAWSQAEVAGRAAGTQAELGWCIDPQHQGQGYATEAVRELIAIAFDLGVRRIETLCFAGNEASWRVMDKVGLRREGYYVRESLHRDGTWHDGISYALLVEEWREGGGGEASTVSLTPPR